MKEDLDYIRNIAEMRAMMERSSKFLSLSGLGGIMAGIYALMGAFIAYQFYNFNPTAITESQVAAGKIPDNFIQVLWVGLIVLALSFFTSYFLSSKKANKRQEKFWDATSRRLLVNMAIPFITGGLMILILISKGLIGLVAPCSLVFYGLALFNAGKYTYNEVRLLGLVQIALGLFSAYFVQYGLLCWAIGFGLVHIIYGIYMHHSYER